MTSFQSTWALHLILNQAHIRYFAAMNKHMQQYANPVRSHSWSSSAAFHFCADNTVVYCSSPEFLQSAFSVVQSHLTQLKLVSNKDKP